MELMECPHCFAKMVLTSDNKCPSCRKDPRDTKNTNPNLTTATFFSYIKLPEYCMACGKPTKKISKFIVNKKDSNWEWEVLGAIPFLGDLFSSLSTFLMPVKLMRKSENSITFKLPFCGKCNNSDVRPIHFNRDTEAITFIVHKTFKRELENRKEKGQ